MLYIDPISMLTQRDEYDNWKVENEISGRFNRNEREREGVNVVDEHIISHLHII